jgi:hypothetical protein
LHVPTWKIIAETLLVIVIQCIFYGLKQIK